MVLYSKVHIVYSDGPIFRSSYVQKVLCSEGPMCRKYLFRRSCSDVKVLCSEGSMFRKNSLQGPIFKRSRVPKVVCSERLVVELFLSFRLRYKNIFISLHFPFPFYLLHDHDNFIIHFFLEYTRMSCDSEVPQISGTWEFHRYLSLFQW